MIIDLQNFAVFCQTSTWLSHRYTYIPSLLKFLLISLPIPPILVDTEPLFEFPDALLLNYLAQWCFPLATLGRRELSYPKHIRFYCAVRGPAKVHSMWVPENCSFPEPITDSIKDAWEVVRDGSGNREWLWMSMRDLCWLVARFWNGIMAMVAQLSVNMLTIIQYILSFSFLLLYKILVFNSRKISDISEIKVER